MPEHKQQTMKKTKDNVSFLVLICWMCNVRSIQTFLGVLSVIRNIENTDDNTTNSRQSMCCMYVQRYTTTIKGTIDKARTKDCNK